MSGVLVYVQHLLGSGHLHRAARVAHALACDGVPVTLCSGGESVAALPAHPGVRFVQLDPLHCAAGDFATLLDHRGQVIDERLRARRLQQLYAALDDAVPQVALIESFPFARRQLRFELLPLLDVLRERAITTVCSIRDILQIKTKVERERETLAWLEAYFAAVLVHGDPRVATLETTFRRAADIVCPVHYTGYVAAPAPAPEGHAEGAGEILVSAGGGAVGYPLLRAALEASRRGCQAGRRWRLLLGSALDPGLRKRLHAEAPSNVRVTPASGRFTQLLRGCALSVSQAGYNTVVDVLQAGCRSLLVPYAQGGEMEQSLRAQRLQALGVTASYNAASLDASLLAARVDEVLERRCDSGVPRVDLSGAEVSARLLQAWL